MKTCPKCIHLFVSFFHGIRVYLHFGKLLAGTLTPCQSICLAYESVGEWVPAIRYSRKSGNRTRSLISLVKKMRLKNQAKYTGSGPEQVMSRPKFDHINSGPCGAELKMHVCSFTHSIFSHAQQWYSSSIQYWIDTVGNIVDKDIPIFLSVSFLYCIDMST